MKEMTTNHRLLAGLAGLSLAAGLTLGLGGCASCSREAARWETDWGKGVPRTVTLYSATGEPIQSWEGIIDVEYNDDGHADLLFFDEEGNVVDRIIITPGGGSLVVDNA